MKNFGLNLFNKEINSHEETKRLLLSLINNHFKTSLISLLSLTLLFSISCSNEGTTGGGTRTLSYYAGDWWGIIQGSAESVIFTINADGSVNIPAGDTTIPSTSITKNSDTSYTYYDEASDGSMNFNFTSDTEGTMTEGQMSAKVTKK